MHDVRDFGAVGDGITDDTQALADAITAAQASPGVVYLPAGTYKTTGPLTADPRRVSLRGDGPQCTIVAPQLDPGDYAFTLGWDNTIAGSTPGPYSAVEGMAFLGTVGANQPNCLRLQGSGTSPQSSGMTFRDVAIRGFDTQVDLTGWTYLLDFDRVMFHEPNAFGVRMDDVPTAGENIGFRSCLWSGGPGTGVYNNKSGSAWYFEHCSFDYLKRAVWQRAGYMAMARCHFETDARHGPGGEFVLLARRGFVNLPAMTLTDCDLYDAWVGYDCFLRLAGDHGGNQLRITSLYTVRAQSGTPYLIREDSPSSVVVDGASYGRGDFPIPKLRRQSGAEVTLTAAARHEV